MLEFLFQLQRNPFDNRMNDYIRKCINENVPNCLPVLLKHSSKKEIQEQKSRWISGCQTIECFEQFMSNVRVELSPRDYTKILMWFFRKSVDFKRKNIQFARRCYLMLQKNNEGVDKNLHFGWLSSELDRLFNLPEELWHDQSQSIETEKETVLLEFILDMWTEQPSSLEQDYDHYEMIIMQWLSCESKIVKTEIGKCILSNALFQEKYLRFLCNQM
jgi:hypothetical protein